MDKLQTDPTSVVVVATSNLSSRIDPMMCRGGRFEQEFRTGDGGPDRVKLLRALLEACFPVDYISSELIEEFASKTGAFNRR
jgi:SpoVK/Ycf46/Vps4 family AAA+-type ATPase